MSQMTLFIFGTMAGDMVTMGTKLT